MLPSKEKAPRTLEGELWFGVLGGGSSAGSRLKQGESFSFSYPMPLNRLFDMTLDGDYKIVVRFTVLKRSVKPIDALKMTKDELQSKMVEVESNTLVIKVENPPPPDN